MTPYQPLSLSASTPPVTVQSQAQDAEDVVDQAQKSNVVVMGTITSAFAPPSTTSTQVIKSLPEAQTRWKELILYLTVRWAELSKNPPAVLAIEDKYYGDGEIIFHLSRRKTPSKTSDPYL